MFDQNPSRVQGVHVGAAFQPSTTAEAIKSLGDLGESVRQANELALGRLRMRPLDALALREISLGAERENFISPKALSASLRITSAAITKLVDRLVDTGRVTRQPNPTDRRSVILVPSATVADDLARAYEKIDSPLISVINGLTDIQLAAVTHFASRLTNALNAEATETAAKTISTTQPRKARLHTAQ